MRAIANPLILKLAGLSVLLFLLGRLSLTLFGSHEGVAYIWLPAGAAFVALLFINRSLWFGVTLGSFFTNVTFGLPLLTSIGISVGSTAGVLAGVYALHLTAFTVDIERVGNAVKFNVVGATISAAVSAVIGSVTLYLTGIVPQEVLTANVLRWWIGDFIGIVIVGAIAWVSIQEFFAPKLKERQVIPKS